MQCVRDLANYAPVRLWDFLRFTSVFRYLERTKNYVLLTKYTYIQSNGVSSPATEVDCHGPEFLSIHRCSFALLKPHL